jgi:hypothetical protein
MTRGCHRVAGPEGCTFEVTTADGWEYQFAVVRAPG